ncbi:endothelin-converting enzyme 1 [Megachile rotundata]|uniref:endothelin-converting enzyme 1 n=1 Tax=Megachile rotundata TaxID=143995 RepID=UPI003FD583AB
MPSRRSYQITSVESSKAIGQDQSYRSCLLALIIFFFLCIILILASLPWKRNHAGRSEYKAEQEKTYHLHGYHIQETTTTTTTPTPIVKYRPTISLTEPQETISETETSTQDYDNVYKFEKLQSVETTKVSTSSANDNESSTYAPSNSTILDFIAKTTTSEIYQTTTDNVLEVTTKNQNDVVETTFQNRQETLTESTVLSTVIDDTTSINSITTPTNSTDNKVCTTGECKNMASKILFYMNHTIDPCEDFYEYACGGFETNPHTVEQNLENMAYRRIFRQMQKEIHEGKSSTFIKYYDSCMQYENVDLSERIKLAKQTLDKVGKFYTTDDWERNHANFTELLANLLLHNSALLFDISPDLDGYLPKAFTLKIGPTMYKNPFDLENTDDPCYAKQLEREQDTVNLGKLYKEYKTCKKNTKKFIYSISEALRALGIFNELKNPYNITQYIQTTVIKIDMELVQKLFAIYPSKSEIREAYLMKNYTLVTIEKLEESYKVVNWTQLIYLLTKEQIKPMNTINTTVRVQVYFYNVLDQGLKSLEEFKAEDPMQLNNALLGLYARNLYHELVLPKQRNAEEYCLRVAASLLIPEASDLYVSSFSRDQLTYMNRTIHNLFEILKETLTLNVKEVKWAAPERRNALIAKINDLKIAVPDISYLNNNNSAYRSTKAYEIDLSDNYFENSVSLMQRYRKLIYAELLTDPNDPEQIWTHYATPFQSKGLAVYELNLVVIPFGVIDWSTKYNELSFDYIILATLGNVIAHQIAHHFDANGIYYWNGIRDTENSLLSDNDDYSQRNIFYQNPMNMTIPSTGQTVTYEILQMSLNERLSEAMGLRLAYDTLDRLRSPGRNSEFQEVHLPWLKLNFDQLFYLTYAQTHCTKSPLTSSYISLYENEQLPSRIRIFVSASNNKLLGKAWKCPDGSQIMPSYTCTPFPYLECDDATEAT